MINSQQFSKGSEHDAVVENTRGESEKDSQEITFKSNLKGDENPTIGIVKQQEDSGCV